MDKNPILLSELVASLPDERERRCRDLLNAAKEFYLYYEQLYQDPGRATSAAVSAAERLLTEIELRASAPIAFEHSSPVKKP